MNISLNLFVNPIKNWIVQPFAMRAQSSSFLQKIADLFDKSIDYYNEIRKSSSHLKLQGICQSYSRLLDLYYVKGDFKAAGDLIKLSWDGSKRKIKLKISGCSIDLDALYEQIYPIVEKRIGLNTFKKTESTESKPKSKEEISKELTSKILQKLFKGYVDEKTGLTKNLEYEDEEKFEGHLTTLIQDELKDHPSLTSSLSDVESDVRVITLDYSIANLIGDHCLAFANVTATLALCQDLMVFGIESLAKVAGNVVGQLRVFGIISTTSLNKILESIFGKATRLFLVVGFCCKAGNAATRIFAQHVTTEQRWQAGREFVAYTAETAFFAILSSSGFGIFVVSVELIRIWNAPGEISLEEVKSLTKDAKKLLHPSP